MKKFKNLISEIQQPLSQGEKNFKDMHGDLPAAIEKARKLVPGITDQDVIFNGRPRRMDPPTASIEDIKKSIDNYDKGLKVGPNPEKTMSEELEKETIKHPVGQRPKGIGWVLKQAGEQTGKDHSVWERKVMRIGKVNEKTLTPAEIKKREEIAKSMERDNPGMPMAKKMAIATATAKRVAEEAEMDYEGEMARSELNAICDKSRKLADMMADDMQLEAWLQSKITKAKYMIDSVYDYLMYSDKQPGMKSPMPAADVSSYAQTPTMAANYSSFLNKMAEEKILSAKQKAIARLDGDPDEIDAADFKKLRSSKKGSDTEETTAHRKKIISKTVEEAKEDDEEKADKQSGASLNPITRLNAAHQLLRGKIGIKHPIKFDDGKHELDINTVRKALDLHGNAKTATEKEKIQNAFKTHAGLQDALKGKFAAPRNKVSLGGSKLIGGIGEYGSVMQEDSDLDERVNPTTRPAAVGALRAATFRDKFGVLRMSKPTKGIPSNRDVVDAMSEEEQPKTSKVNMQQDSLDRLNAMSPQASKIKTKLPPTQGNKPIGGDEEIYPDIATEEILLNNLYRSLSEDNKATFMEKLRTEDGLSELLQFAEEQGL